MTISRMLINDFITYFRGNEKVYGQHTFGTFIDGAKEKGGRNETVKNTLINDELYITHLEGTGPGLGIVPINYDNMCKFCVIDIDIYDSAVIKNSALRVIKAIMANNLPVSVFKSKSGGFHLYIFFKDFIPAVKARALAQKFIRLLSMDKICTLPNKSLEVFPKQNTLTQEQQGSWINLPYYNAAEGDRQAMLDENLDPMDLESAMIKLRDRVRSHEEYEEILQNSNYNDGPPCMQSLYYLNDVSSNRNNYLFSFGVYLFKKNEDTFAHELYAINQRLPEPLPDNELEGTVLKSIRTKSYGYKCKESPLCELCSKTECRLREFGIGDGKHVSDLDFGKLKQLASDPPEYYWNINDVEIRFRNEEELLNQNKFRAICVRKLLFAPYKMKDDAWIKALNGFLGEAEIQDIDGEEIDQKGRLMGYFTEYLTQRAAGRVLESVRSGRTFKDETTGKIYFKGAAFAEWVHTVKNYREFTVGDIGHFLRYEQKCTTETVKPQGRKEFRCMSIDASCLLSMDFVEEIVEDVEFEPETVEIETVKEPKY
jgi:hypothetical protein